MDLHSYDRNQCVSGTVVALLAHARPVRSLGAGDNIASALPGGYDGMQ